MTIEQIVEIPANRRIAIEVPHEVPTGKVVLTFTPAAQAPLHPCPICAAHIDPVTGNPRYNAETAAAIEEGIAVSNGEIPVKWHKPHEFEKVWQDLLNGEDTDESSNPVEHTVTFQRTGSHSDLF